MNGRTCKIAVLILIFCSTVAMGQNLVPNPSFEEFYRAPFSFSDTPDKFKLPGWNSATQGTPDYFHAASAGNASVPLNWAGESEAHSGQGYAGIFVGGRPGRDGKVYREYIQCKLNESLRRDSIYKLEFFYKLSSYSHYMIDRVGMLLLDSEMNIRHNQVVKTDPTLSIIRSSMQTGGWESARMLYKARGGESFLVIGNFFDDETTENQQLKMRATGSHTLRGTAYFYIDDVSVALYDENNADSTLVLPDSGEIKVNNAYVLRNIQFEFDSYQLLPTSFPELSRLVKVMKMNPRWNLEINGHADDQGTDEYNLQLSLNRAKSVADFLVTQGINPFKITIKGFGNKLPLKIGKDEETRAMNRRVQVEFQD